MVVFSPGRAIKSRKRARLAAKRRAASRNEERLFVLLGEVTGQEDLYEYDGRNAVFEFGVLLLCQT